MKRDHIHLTRIKCPTRLRMHYKAKKDRYVVLVFEEAYNHELTPSTFIHLHPIYRQIYEADRAQINVLPSHEIRTCHIMGYMIVQKGRYVGVGFTKKDMYSYFDKKMCDIIKDTVVVSSLNYRNVKSSNDLILYVKYVVNSDGRMKSLFLAYGRSRFHSFYFGK